MSLNVRKTKPVLFQMSFNLLFLLLSFQTVLEAEYRQIREKNCQESKKVCESIIKHVFVPMEENGSSAYTVPGGYNKYCTDLQMMTKIYRRTKGKGVKVCWGEVVLSNDFR